jgi:hypothetical protein
MASVNAVRRAGAALVVLGLVLSAFTPEPSPGTPVRAAGYTVLAGDFHVHGFPDGIPAWDSAREARRRRLDVIALTSHNSRVGWWMWTHRPSWADAGDVLVLPGEELTSVGYHLALIGVSNAVGWNRPLANAAEAAHAQGAVAILAHPGGDDLKRVISDAGLRAVDGIEIAHPGMERAGDTRRDSLEIFARTLALNAHTAAIGSSDFHYFEPIGLCRTYVFVGEESLGGVLDAIRAGRTVACDARGAVYGPDALRPLVADRCRQDARSSPAGDTAVSRLATVLTWTGLLALVLAGVAT